MSDLHALATRVVKTLTERDLTLAAAESLTGGLLGATITTVPGASKVYLGGVISYATSLKETMLSIDPADIAAFSVISGQVAAGMAAGVSALTRADWSIGVTGVAGPDPQDGHAPGEVWICCQGPKIGSLPAPTQVLQYQFEGDRSAVREASVEAALSMLLRILSPV